MQVQPAPAPPPPPPPPPHQRREIRCGYCRNPGHNIAGCNIYKMKLDMTIIDSELNILERHQEPIHLKTRGLNIDNLTRIKLFFEGHLPYIIRNNYTLMKKDDQNGVNVEIEEKEKLEIKQLKKDLNNFEKENNTINEYAVIFNDIRRRITHYRENCLGPYYISWHELSDILKIDNYVEYIERLNNERIARREERQRQMEEYRQRREAELLARQIQAPNNNAIISRTLLPILRETVIESDDCPICLETLSETNKSVLRCGHPLCTNCLITQTLVNFKNGMCKCPVCRERII